MDDLRGRVALITGGGRGIGRAIALALAREGCDLAVAARSGEQVEAVASEARALGRRALALRADLSRREEPAALAARVERELGPVDVLVNNAGIDATGAVQKTDDATWDSVLAVNLTAPFLLSRAVLPGMYARGFGRVLNVASVAGLTGLRYGGAYCASKHGLVGLTRALAAECPRKGVTANALCPGWTETRMLEGAVAGVSRATGRNPEEALAALLRHNPMGRAATPEEVAAMALAIVRNPAVNGQAVQVDGGELMA